MLLVRGGVVWWMGGGDGVGGRGCCWCGVDPQKQSMHIYSDGCLSISTDPHINDKAKQNNNNNNKNNNNNNTTTTTPASHTQPPPQQQDENNKKYGPEAVDRVGGEVQAGEPVLLVIGVLEHALRPVEMWKIGVGVERRGGWWCLELVD